MLLFETGKKLGLQTNEIIFHALQITQAFHEFKNIEIIKIEATHGIKSKQYKYTKGETIQIVEMFPIHLIT